MTNDRPGPVRIDDLADPRFGDDARAVLDFMEESGSGIRLEPEPLMQAARDETGLADYGPTDFAERLDVLCRAMRDEGGFNGAGILQQHALLVGLLKNRLLLQDLWRRHPEILGEEIARPIIICGLPRTGTTHLHNLMSADPALRSLPYWESIEPVLADRDRPAPGEPDPRLARTQMALDFLDAAMPYFNRMHEMTVEHTHEEIQLLAIDVSTMLFETAAPMPLWRDHYLARDQRPSYAYLRTILQTLQWLRGGTRWVLKSPQHLEQFPALVETFPDATFVVTHRDPVSVTASMVMMLAYSARLTRDRVDVEGIGHYWANRLELMLGRCADDHHVLPADQTIDVHFDAFMADDLAMVRRVYELADQPLDTRSWAAMKAFMAQHPRGKIRRGPLRLDRVRAQCRRAAAGTVVLHGPLRRDPRVLADRRTPNPVPPAYDVHREVGEQHERRRHMPPDVAEGDPEAAGVEDHLVAREQIVRSRHQHVECQQGQDEVRPRQPSTAAEPRAGAPQVPEQARHGVAALHHVHDRPGPRTPARRPGAASPP